MIYNLLDYVLSVSPEKRSRWAGFSIKIYLYLLTNEFIHRGLINPQHVSIGNLLWVSISRRLPLFVVLALMQFKLAQVMTEE